MIVQFIDNILNIAEMLNKLTHVIGNLIKQTMTNKTRSRSIVSYCSRSHFYSGY